MLYWNRPSTQHTQSKLLLLFLGWLFSNIHWTSGSKKPFVEYFEHFSLFLALPFLKWHFLTLQNFLNLLLFTFLLHRSSFFYLRRRLHVKFHPVIELIGGWNYLSPWQSVYFRSNEISSWDELIPVKNSTKRSVSTSYEFLQWAGSSFS